MFKFLHWSFEEYQMSLNYMYAYAVWYVNLEDVAQQSLILDIK